LFRDIKVASLCGAELNLDRYLTSNVNITVNGISRPLGSRYRKFKTPVNNYTILAFGVLFDFTGNDKFVSTCQPVHDLINERWFQTVLRDETRDVDVIVVVGHTPLRNSTGFEYDLVLSAIRAHLPTIPVQFFGGHSHIRDFRKYDDLAHGIESGRYLETLGWINMDLNPFRLGRRYIDNNLGAYRFHTEIEEKQEFETQEGKGISEEIQKKVPIFLS
jgi:2',3'-cyclic-nucleotide 2'-phosphodiesterase (5'-nucleotidase family)